MDAKKFLREIQRMCKNSNCHECSFKGRNCNYPYIDGDTDKAVDAVERWSKEHPITTNADKLKEIFGLKADSLQLISGSVYQDGKLVSIPTWLHSEYRRR